MKDSGKRSSRKQVITKRQPRRNVLVLPDNPFVGRRGTVISFFIINEYKLAETDSERTAC